MTRAVVALPPLPRPVDQLWHVLLDLGRLHDLPWTLIGGQMVLLHALEHGQFPPQISQDGDVVADIRGAPASVSAVVSAPQDRGFTVDGMSPTGVAHRYVRPAHPRPVTVDVLAPDGVGERADLTTTRPGRTVQVPGGTQALHRSELVDVAHEGRTGPIPRPSLLGALVLKGAACALIGDRSRHLRDTALLCSLVADPFELADELTVADRRRLRRAGELNDPGHPAWQLLTRGPRQAGQEAYRLLTDRPAQPLRG